MRKSNPALEALRRAVNRAIERGDPVYVNQPVTEETVKAKESAVGRYRIVNGESIFVGSL